MDQPGTSCADKSSRGGKFATDMEGLDAFNFFFKLLLLPSEHSTCSVSRQKTLPSFGCHRLFFRVFLRRH